MQRQVLQVLHPKKDESFFKQPYAARACQEIYGIWMIPCPDCRVEWYGDRTSFLKKDENGICFHDLICFNECPYGFLRKLLSEKEIRYLIKIGRKKDIK